MSHGSLTGGEFLDSISCKVYPSTTDHDNIISGDRFNISVRRQFSESDLEGGTLIDRFRLWFGSGSGRLFSNITTLLASEKAYTHIHAQNTNQIGAGFGIAETPRTLEGDSLVEGETFNQSFTCNISDTQTPFGKISGVKDIRGEVTRTVIKGGAGGTMTSIGGSWYEEALERSIDLNLETLLSNTGLTADDLQSYIESTGGSLESWIENSTYEDILTTLQTLSTNQPSADIGSTNNAISSSVPVLSSVSDSSIARNQETAPIIAATVGTVALLGTALAVIYKKCGGGRVRSNAEDDVELQSTTPKNPSEEKDPTSSLLTPEKQKEQLSWRDRSSSSEDKSQGVAV